MLKCLEYSLEIFKWFNNSYEKEEKVVKEKLLESVNKNFKKMYHGNREVTLNEKYQINLESIFGDARIKTDESKGLEAVKNFSFVTGLVDLARERARTKAKDEVNVYYSEPYPLVMDAPFSNVDEIHIDKIASILPDSAEQVILILMKKDWEHAEKSISDRICQKYIIEKVNNTETYSRISPEC
jgi:DNA sulfur modification protein DndD